MKIESINNIIPEVIEWSLPQEPDFGFWNFFTDGGPFEQFEYLLDSGKIEEDKILGVVDCIPFNGHYQSDEVHDYNVIFFRGEYVGINHKVADKSSRKWYWKDENVFGEILSYLFKHYLSLNSDSETLTEEISIKASSSHYQHYIKLDGETYVIVNDFSWGNIRGQGLEYLLTVNESDELYVVGEIKKIVHAPRSSYLIDYSTVTLKDDSEHVIWFTGWKRPKNEKEYFYAKKVMK